MRKSTELSVGSITQFNLHVWDVLSHLLNDRRAVHALIKGCAGLMNGFFLTV